MNYQCNIGKTKKISALGCLLLYIVPATEDTYFREPAWYGCCYFSDDSRLSTEILRSQLAPDQLHGSQAIQHAFFYFHQSTNIPYLLPNLRCAKSRTGPALHISLYAQPSSLSAE